MWLLHVLFFCLLVACNCKRKAPQERVYDNDLSSEQHHDHEGKHNPEYDHEAFLGKDAHEFDELTPEQSKERLGDLYHLVDKNGDNFITDDELRKWIKHTQNRYIWEDANKQMKENDLNKDGFVTWEEYMNATYGFLDAENEEHYKDMISRDRRRFTTADVAGVKKLNEDEFATFLHPENADHMRPIVVQETLEDIDKNKDGYIDLDEYIGDLWPEEDKKSGNTPDWVIHERKSFKEFRDKNSDGKLDNDEVAQWILPPDFDHIRSESNHLISESDADKDGKLTKEEVLNKFDLFVGSQATDFGEALRRIKNEL